MARGDPDEFWPELERLGEDEVRRKLASGAYYGSRLASAQAWLHSKERDRATADAAREREQARHALWYQRGGWWTNVILAICTVGLLVYAGLTYCVQTGK